jgi:DNA-binding protein
VIAQGMGIAKAVTVAEITKRRLRGLHQNTQISLLSNASHDSAGGEAASAASKADVPAIVITLSMLPLDPTEPGCTGPAPSCLSVELLYAHSM